MHFQDVFRAIYANHYYEYIIINDALEIIEFSDQAQRYCEANERVQAGIDVIRLVPELYGMHERISGLFRRDEPPFLIPLVHKSPDYYVNIRLHQGRNNPQSGQCETMIILFEDITDLAKMEQRSIQDRNEKALLLQELEEKNRQLQHFNDHMQELVAEETRKNLEKQKMLELQSRHSQMGEMIGMITHQWKQPLGVIAMIGGLCGIRKAKGKISEAFYEEQIAEIMAQAKLMQQTVEDFQDFFNPSKEKVFFNVKATIEKMVALIAKDYEIRGISLELIGEEHINVIGYPNEYNQVILSLLKNARDAFEDSMSVDKKVVVEVTQEHDASLVKVRDNAGGIDEAVIDTLFDLYISTKKQGSGLGLNIAKNVIECNMDGKLSAHNVEEGAEFLIRV